MSIASQSPRNWGSFVDADFDLSGLGAALWRKKRNILGPTIIVALLTLVAVQLVSPKYLSEARVLVEARDNIYLRPDADKDMSERTVDEQAVTSQAQLVLSRDLAREVIAKLKLGERPEFDPALSGLSPIRAVLGLLGLSKYPLSMTPEERVLEAYYDRLIVTPIDKSRVITIDFLSQDPELAARAANAIADAYLERQRSAKQDQARIAAQYLSGQIETMRKKVADAEAKVEAFRAKSNLLVGNNNTTLSAQQLGDFNAQLAAARGLKADSESKAKMIREMLRSGQPIESSDILNSELFRRLSEQRVTLRAQLAEQSSSLLDNHPRIKELKAQIGALDQQMREEAETVVHSFESDAKLASARVDSLIASFDQLKSQAATTNEQDVQLRALERDAKSQRDLLESYLAKYSEATARDTANSSPADARVFSRATVSNVPAYPKKLPTVLIAAFTTLLLTSGLMVTRELLAAPSAVAPVGVTPRSTIGEAVTSRVASIVNRVRPDETPFGIPFSAIGEIARSLRRDGADARIAIFGAVPGFDTDPIALDLGRTLAVQARVVLVGLGPTDAAIRAASSEPSSSGLAELAGGTASFRDIITRDKQSGLHLITSGQLPTDRIEILAASTTGMSFDALARSYDHVVVDAGVIGGPELGAIAQIAPHAILVTGITSGSATASARERLLAAGFTEVTVLAGGRGRRSTDTAVAA